MARFSARLTLCIFLLTVSITLAVRGLAYDRAYFTSVRAALTFTAPCSRSPCFESIIPGETSLDDAIRILRGDIRIEDVEVSSYIAHADEFIRVAWAWRDTGVYAEGSLMEMHRRGSAIEWISLPTNLTFGEVWLAAGKPRAGHVDHVLLTARYADFYAISPSACDGFWSAPVALMRAGSGIRHAEEDIAGSLLRVTCAETGYEGWSG
jgi:hypothetical protein